MKLLKKDSNKSDQIYFETIIFSRIARAISCVATTCSAASRSPLSIYGPNLRIDRKQVTLNMAAIIVLAELSERNDTNGVSTHVTTSTPIVNNCNNFHFMNTPQEVVA